MNSLGAKIVEDGTQKRKHVYTETGKRNLTIIVLGQKKRKDKNMLKTNIKVTFKDGEKLEIVEIKEATSGSTVR